MRFDRLSRWLLSFLAVMVGVAGSPVCPAADEPAREPAPAVAIAVRLPITGTRDTEMKTAILRQLDRLKGRLKGGERGVLVLQLDPSDDEGALASDFGRSLERARFLSDGRLDGVKTVAFLPQVQGGKLNALAVTDARPSPVAPQLPTVAASGLPGFEVLQWFGLLAPTGTPREIVARVNADVGKALQLPEVQDKLKGLGMQIVGGPPEQFSGFMRAEAIKWGKIVKDSGAKVD